MASIKKQLLSGIFFTAISKYSGMIISLVVSAILSRLIPPSEFGIVAIATVIITFFGIFTDVGISPAIIQDKELTNKDYSNIFSFTAWFGAILAFLFFISSWPIASYYNNSTLRTLCQLLSINLLFASLNIVPDSLLFKAKEFKFLAIRTFWVQLAGGIISVIAALSGAGLYSLIINPILSSVLLFIISFQKYPQKISLSFGLESIRKIFSFSFYQFLFSVLNYFSRNIDKLLIGKYMNMSSLGFYEKSYRLMMLPIQNITHVVSPVMHPIFSDLQHNIKELSISYEKVIRILAFISFPLSVLLFFIAKELTILIFGPQWMPSVAIFEVLALTCGTQIILSTSGSIFQASNDTKSLLICGLFSSIVTVAAISIGIFAFHSLEAVAWGIFIAFSLSFLQCYIWMYKVTFKRSMIGFWKQFFSPIILTIITSFILHFANRALDNMSLLMTLIIKCILFLTIWLSYIHFTGEFDIFAKISSFFKSHK